MTGASTLIAWQFRENQPPTLLGLEEILSKQLLTESEQRRQDIIPTDEGDASAVTQQARSLIWMDMTNYSADELSQVGHTFGLNRSGIRMTLAPWQRPRLTVYPSHFFVSATVPHLDVGSYQIHAGELDLFVSSSFVISAHKTSLPFLEQMQARILNSAELVSRHVSFLLYILLDTLMSYYEELNRRVQEEIERLEERALRDATDAFLEDLVRFKRYTFVLSQLADQHRDVFLAFIQPDFVWEASNEEIGEREEIHEDIEESFAELHDRLARLTDRLLNARDAVNGAFDIYVSHQSHRTNQVIRLLTIVSIVLFTASIVVSVFGTTLLATLHTSLLTSPIGLLVMVLVIILTNLGTLWVFRRRNWI